MLTEHLQRDDSPSPSASEPQSGTWGLPPLDATGPEEPFRLPEVDPAYYQERVRIGAGGMGRVFAATDTRLRRRVALKELRTHSQELRLRFEREVLLTARLQHPSIVRVHEAGRWPTGEPFYAMELVRGRPLDQIMAEKETFDERLALLPYVLAVADAIAYAHQQRVIHRDLKPSNILIGELGETVVVDWGIATELADGAATSSETTTNGAVVGTPAYMPPEQATGGHVDARADVYAIGATLYHLLAGHPPYGPVSGARALDAVRNGPPPSLSASQPRVPRDLQAIVERAMARNAAERHSSGRELRDDLHHFQAGQSRGAHRDSLRERVMRGLRRCRVVCNRARSGGTSLA